MLSSVLGTRGELREAFLTQATGQACQTVQVGEPWTSSSPIKCYLECMLFYPDTCQSIIYNSYTQNNCRSGSVAFRPMVMVITSIPETDSTDDILYARQPIPPCDTSGNFALYEICGTTVCLHLSSSLVNYTQAKANCAQMNSRLFIANSMVRLSVFWHVSRDYLNYNTWLGLTDISQEDTFVWDNGDLLSDEMDQYVWHTNQPNNDGDEDCMEARHSEVPSPRGINDDNCYQLKKYICEPYDAYDAK